MLPTDTEPGTEGASAPAEHPFKARAGLRRFLNAWRHSMDGFTSAYRHEHAFRIELLAAAVLVPLACWLDLAGAERAMLIASVLLVLIVELVNSAVEATVDRVSLERHPLAKRAKDLGSAAVCLTLVNAAAVWLAVLLGR